VPFFGDNSALEINHIFLKLSQFLSTHFVNNEFLEQNFKRGIKKNGKCKRKETRKRKIEGNKNENIGTRWFCSREMKNFSEQGVGGGGVESPYCPKSNLG
jgi:hypothetical protein